ncbi:MAG: arginine deiminase-related protein, partial [Gemmatimonadaceae bacterium]
MPYCHAYDRTPDSDTADSGTTSSKRARYACVAIDCEETPIACIAISRAVSRALERCELTHLPRRAIDLALARRQHVAYEQALREAGCEVRQLAEQPDYPDCVFVEDTAIVLDELAVMMSPGAESRRGEPRGIEPELSRYREIERVSLPATIDGGDVVRAGRHLYVGESPRTNAAGISELRRILAPYGYEVTDVPVTGCLHLKTACSALPDGRFLVNGDWIDTSPFPAGALLPVPNSEPWAGDVLVIGNQIIASDAFPET